MAKRDGCAVETEAVAALIRTFVTSWNLTRPSTDGQFTGTSLTGRVDPVRPYEYLALETGLNERTIERIAGNRQTTISLAAADALVQALGHPEAFHDGTLRVVPNPSASAAARAEFQATERVARVDAAVARVEAMYGFGSVVRA